MDRVVTKYALSILLLFACGVGFGQDFEQLLNDAHSVQDQDPSECERLLDEILEADSALVAVSVRLQSLQLLGLLKMYNYQFDESNALFDRAFSLVDYLQTEENKLVGSLYLDIGRNFNWQSQYDSALGAFLKAKRVYESSADKKGIAQSLNSIAVIAIQYSNDPVKALSYFQSALLLHQEMNDDESSARVMQNIGQIHNMMSSNDSALFFIRESNRMVESLNDLRSLAIGSNILGAIFYDLSEYDSSEYYYKKAIGLDIQNQDSVGLIYDYSQLSTTLFANRNFDEAIRYASLAFQNAKDIYLKSESAEVLSDVYEAKGQFQAALYYEQQFKYYSDSVRREDQQTTIDELQTKYEITEKEKQILEANKEIDEKERFEFFLMVIIAIILFFSALAIFLILQRFKLKRALLSQEIDTLRLQINSIFDGGFKQLDVDLHVINEGLYKPLSEREFEVLSEAISDKTNSEIADAVFVSVNTVKFHLKNIYEKLGVTNRKEALEAILAKK